MNLDGSASAEEVHAAVRKLMAAMRKPSLSVPELPPMHPDDYHRYADHEGHCVWLSYPENGPTIDTESGDDDAPTIKVIAATNKIGSEVENEFEVPEDWGTMTPSEKREFLADAEQEHLSGYVECWARVYDDEGDEVTDFFD